MKHRITNLLLSAGLMAAAGTAFAQSNIGAPTSAAGGVYTEPLSPGALPGAVGPLDSSGGLSDFSGPLPEKPVGVGGSTSSSIQERMPGTGKFEAPNNAPCIGTTGFGSTNAIPGHKC
ncbi:MAG TPA: hypothetical protein VMT54_04290 [Candidatus Cybelea sp.]|nr:hypothetical protein [Candidatus Cybelea sp.]